jgi:hypothetical protein
MSNSSHTLISPAPGGDQEHRDGQLNHQLQALRSADHQRLKSLETLVRLVMIDNFACGSSYTLAGFLASIYNGHSANLHNMGGVDSDAVEHAINVLRLHVTGHREIHTFFDHGAPLFDPDLGMSGEDIFARMISDYCLDNRRPERSEGNSLSRP